jgi:antitoxin YefM
MAEAAVISGIRQKAVVGDNGKIEIVASGLPKGSLVEVIVLTVEQDTTEYLLSTQANRQHLLRAMDDLQDRAKYTFVDIDEL